MRKTHVELCHEYESRDPVAGHWKNILLGMFDAWIKVSSLLS